MAATDHIFHFLFRKSHTLAIVGSLGEYQSPGKDRVEMAEKSKKTPKKMPKQMPRQQQQQRQEQDMREGSDMEGRRGTRSEMPDRRGEQDRRQ